MTGGAVHGSSPPLAAKAGAAPAATSAATRPAAAAVRAVRLAPGMERGDSVVIQHPYEVGKGPAAGKVRIAVPDDR
ncbi:hypothetical protein Sviol_81350 [Streptomyces violascens]|uniref:Uncharacterized protein n=1 Tax=Streptomyces violascens TaxID=67381 RepID=A0ABQ3R2K3_9ACTN|nr:hypothetical protein Sviol_81350 [Streptomyces violascens]